MFSEMDVTHPLIEMHFAFGASFILNYLPISCHRSLSRPYKKVRKTRGFPMFSEGI